MPRLSTPKSGEQLQSWNPGSFDRLVEAACDRSRVSGLTHNFYKYPARFSPKFVRAAIQSFSEPGDLVLDPFMGGGTTLVEALALGRHAIGTDISSLAVFVADVKTTLFNDYEFAALERWADRLSERINMRDQANHFRGYAENGYYRHLNTALTWRLRKAVEQAREFYRLGLRIYLRCNVLLARFFDDGMGAGMRVLQIWPRIAFE